MDVQTEEAEEDAAAPSSAVEIYTDSYSANLDALFAKKGIAHGVRRLIEAGIAAIHDDDAVALAAALDEMPVNVNFCPVSAFPGGDSLLCYAARFNAPRCVEILLSHGASPDLILEGGDTALLAAVMQSPRAWEQWGFLHTEGGESKAGAAAAARGRMARAVKVLKQLLGAGADINLADADGYSPLYLAGHFGMPEFVTILLTAGADVEQRANNGFTPLGQAVFDGQTPCVELLLGARAAVDRLDAADGSGRAPLWHAASSGHADCLRLLLASGADVGLAPTCGNAKDEFLAGTTAFFIACQRGHIECAEALLQAGAAVDETLRDCDGFSALLMAAANGHPDCVRVCIGAGANVNIVAKSGLAPLSAACYHGHHTSARLLIEGGAVLNLAVGLPLAHTPLLLACQQGHPECVRVLCDSGADVDEATANGITPLCKACQHGRLECAQIVSSFGASRQTPVGTPEQAATQNGHSDVAAWLAASRCPKFLHQYENGALVDSWLPLQHLEACPRLAGQPRREGIVLLTLHHCPQALTVERARALLRGGADPLAGEPSALERARALCLWSESDPTAAAVGSTVAIHSLVSRPSLNGKTGVVVSANASSGRFGVLVAGEAKTLALRRGGSLSLSLPLPLPPSQPPSLPPAPPPPLFLPPSLPPSFSLPPSL